MAGTTRENKFIVILITFVAKFSKNNNTKKFFLHKKQYNFNQSQKLSFITRENYESLKKD